ncbi:MAG: hypothetical protein M1817_003962 [Caeruleum heppii]|nr:MAG: hypothetical protein M1817_003962 [Caeruleum heppii]
MEPTNTNYAAVPPSHVQIQYEISARMIVSTSARFFPEDNCLIRGFKTNHQYSVKRKSTDDQREQQAFDELEQGFRKMTNKVREANAELAAIIAGKKECEIASDSPPAGHAASPFIQQRRIDNGLNMVFEAVCKQTPDGQPGNDTTVTSPDRASDIEELEKLNQLGLASGHVESSAKTGSMKGKAREQSFDRITTRMANRVSQLDPADPQEESSKRNDIAAHEPSGEVATQQDASAVLELPGGSELHGQQHYQSQRCAEIEQECDEVLKDTRAVQQALRHGIGWMRAFNADKSFEAYLDEESDDVAEAQSPKDRAERDTGQKSDKGKGRAEEDGFVEQGKPEDDVDKKDVKDGAMKRKGKSKKKRGKKTKKTTTAPVLPAALVVEDFQEKVKNFEKHLQELAVDYHKIYEESHENKEEPLMIVELRIEQAFAGDHPMATQSDEAKTIYLEIKESRDIYKRELSIASAMREKLRQYIEPSVYLDDENWELFKKRTLSAPAIQRYEYYRRSAASHFVCNKRANAVVMEDGARGAHILRLDADPKLLEDARKAYHECTLERFYEAMPTTKDFLAKAQETRDSLKAETVKQGREEWWTVLQRQ